jgi:hypothetical protein
MKIHFDQCNSEILIKTQIIDDITMKFTNELQSTENDFEALQHKYDRKELILQNLERKLNYFEMYIVKQGSQNGRNDKEA